MKAYYNENDPNAAAWLRELIAARLIADGDVDERSICEVQASDLIGYGQVHLFAGVAGWSYALRLAGIPDDFPVWTCSAPCQPFSQAGEQKGFNDERHLWPEALRLIQQRNPILLLGEQVASELGRVWLSGVRADLEKLGYAVGASDLCAASAGAPHQRQRLYWFAVNPLAHDSRQRCDWRSTAAQSTGWPITETGYTTSGMADPEHNGGRTDEQGRRPEERTADGRTGRLEHTTSDGRDERRPESDGWGATCRCSACGLEHANCSGSQSGRQATKADGHRDPTEPAGDICGVGDAYDARSQGRGWPKLRQCECAWSNFDIIPCRDGKARRIESSNVEMASRLPDWLVHLRDLGAREAEILTEVQETFPLIKNASARAMRLRGYGNAIVPPLASIFIRSAFEAIEMARTEKVEVFEQSTLF